MEKITRAPKTEMVNFSVPAAKADAIQKDLFSLAMGGKWEQVVKMYKENPAARTAKITRSGDTALHIATSNNLTNVVENLVNSLPEEERTAVLSIGNDRRNTPLHIAASLGSVPMCSFIAKQGNPTHFIRLRNGDGETPLFLAVLHRMKEAFLCLHYLCGGFGYEYCRRNCDGATILHFALIGEQLELAQIIIDLYPKLVFCVNDQGISPLQVLASKPSVFKGASPPIKGCNKLVYNWLSVGRPKAYDPNTYQGKDQNKKRSADVEDPALTLDSQQQANISSMEHGAAGRLLKYFRLNSISEIKKIREVKQKHVWSVEIVERVLCEHFRNSYEYVDDGRNPHLPPNNDELTLLHTIKNDDCIGIEFDREDVQPTSFDCECTPRPEETMGNLESVPGIFTDQMGKRETAILIAARNGVLEMVELIARYYPVAIQDVDLDEKNILLLAAEYRQPKVYKYLLSLAKSEDLISIFPKVDKDGNSAAHLAAKMSLNPSPWLIPGAALQLQSEIHWHEYVEKSMPPNFFPQPNRNGETPKQIFTKTHEVLLGKGIKWLDKTSESCSVVAALIATVAFATSATIPGDWKDTGIPNQENNIAFLTFAYSSIIALCGSFTSIVLFLSILTSRKEEEDFRVILPRRLLVGLSCLFVSLVVMLVSFCASHFFSVKEKMKDGALPFYIVICVVVTNYCIPQFPWYFDFLLANIDEPQRSYE